MIRKFEHGVLCLRDHDKHVVNICPKFFSTKPYRLAIALVDNQIFKDHNPLLAPRVLADWIYQ
jgi:hypothetical protein